MRSASLSFLLFIFAACSSPTEPNGPRAPQADDGVILFHRILRDVPAFEPWSILPDGTALERVDQPFRVSDWLSVDSAGTRLAFTEAGDVIVAYLQGPLLWRALTNDGRRSRPWLSPDGEWVASVWQAPDGRRDEIRVARTDGGGEHTILVMPLGVNPPVILGWFPGGDTLLVQRSDLSATTQYFGVTRSSGSTQELDEPALRGSGRAALSPSGRYFAVSDRGPLGSDSSKTILIIDRKTRTVGPLLSLPHGAAQVAWSPDEQYLVHVPMPGSSTRVALEIIEVGTGQRHVLLDIAEVLSFPSNPSWVRALQ